MDEDTEMQDADAVNGHVDTNGDSTPVPPPHKVQSPPPKPAIDPEACKATGNKYFKAKDYPKAIAEYTKGEGYRQLSLSLSRHLRHGWY